MLDRTKTTKSEDKDGFFASIGRIADEIPTLFYAVLGLIAIIGLVCKFCQFL